MRRFFSLHFSKYLSTLLKSTYPLTTYVGRKEMRREWEKKSKRRELGTINESTLEQFAPRKDILGKGDRIKAIPLVTKPRSLPCC